MEGICVIILPPKFTLNRLKDELSRKLLAARPSEPHHWSLSHHLFRSATAESTGPQTQQPQQTLQILTLSSYQSHSFVHTTTTSSSSSIDSSSSSLQQPQQATANTIAVPHSSPSLQDALGNDSAATTTTNRPKDPLSTLPGLLAQKLNALWSPARSYSLEITDGRAWDAGVFNLMAGEVVASAVGAGRVSRGTVVVVRLSEAEGVEGRVASAAKGNRRNGTAATEMSRVDEGAMDVDEAPEQQEAKEDNDAQEQNTRQLIQEFIDILEVDALDVKRALPREERNVALEQFWRVGYVGMEDTGEVSLSCARDGSSFWGASDDWKGQASLWCDVLKSKHLGGSAVRRT